MPNASSQLQNFSVFFIEIIFLSFLVEFILECDRIVILIQQRSVLGYVLSERDPALASQKRSVYRCNGIVRQHRRRGRNGVVNRKISEPGRLDNKTIFHVTVSPEIHR